MTEIPIGSKLRTTAIINKYLMRAKKALGQNFLIDPTILSGIVTAADITPGDQVIEIGPGIGSLTEQLLVAGAKVLAYEVDTDLEPILMAELPTKIADKPLAERFKLLLKDVLKADFKADLAGFFDLEQPIKVVANLPYYITTPIIFALSQSALHFTSLTLMMQQEVAQRLVAEPHTKAYGPLTLAIQSEMRVNLALAVDRHSFMPAPKVDSSVVVLIPLADSKLGTMDRKQFNRIVKLCFAKRRKTLNNNLKGLVSPERRTLIFEKLALPAMVRPEELSLAQFLQLVPLIMGHELAQTSK